MSSKHVAPKKKKKKTKAGSVFRRIRNFILIVILLGAVVGTGVLAGMFAAVTKEMEDLNIKNAALNFSSFIYCDDENGNSIQIDHLYDENNRIWVDSQDIPQKMKEAVVSIEDERFYNHIGFDVKRTTGAFVKWALNKIGIGEASYGGSTITQQLVKNVTNESDKTAMRKLKEIMRAVALERELSKDEILTMYLNIVYFSNNCYGVQAASNAYFEKNVDELSLAQIAALVGIPQRPSAFDPFKHPESTVERRDVVLGKMLELGYITQEEYDSATSEELVVNTAYKAKKSQISSYFVDQVINDVINDLQEERGYSETYAKQQLYNGGLRIYTTMDVKIQTIMENVFTDVSNFPKVSGTQAQSAMIIIDPYTGAVKGIVGGLGKKTESRGLNRATQSKRQPGSSIKPLAAYAAAYENGKITSATLLKDEPVTYGKWSPRNSYSGFKGNMLPRKAIEISSNIAAVKALDQSGVGYAYGFMKNTLEFSSIEERDMGLSPLALGGLTIGVSPEEMAAGYAIFVNGGKYIEPYTYTKVVDESGKVLLERDADSKTALSPQNAFIVGDLLKDVVNGSAGTGRSARLSKMPAYGKTGTTNDDKDRWFVGFTPYYVGAVWYGFDQPKSIKSAGVTYNPSTRVWKNVMEQVHSELEVKSLTMPDGVVTENICTATGLKAGSGCASSVEYFVKGTQPKSVCGSRHTSGAADTDLPEDNETSEVQQDGVQSTTTPQGDTGSEAKTEIEVTEKPEKTAAPTGSAEMTEKPKPVETPKPAEEIPSATTPAPADNKPEVIDLG